ncbi:MAG: hypothetical protein DMG39_13940 [Acidobacteria bacterium]|nr:MAG: hypothetical protein DMG39_13940 [Acidobacteriota bacterium]
MAKIQVALLGRSITTITGPDGKFHLSQLPAGSYVLQVSGVGYRSFQISFQLESPEEAKEFAISLAPENFRRTERVEVSGDVFEPQDWPAVGDLTLTSSELRQTATVLADDPFRSLQTLPGVSPSANNDFHAQFSVMGAPFSHVGVYVDDVFVPNVLHTGETMSRTSASCPWPIRFAMRTTSVPPWPSAPGPEVRRRLISMVLQASLTAKSLAKAVSEAVTKEPGLSTRAKVI